jgi:hypothetical protein
MGNRNEQLAQRRAAEVTGYTLHVDRPDVGVEIYTKPLVGEKILAKGFRGRAGKPAWFYSFKNAAELETYIQREIDSRQRHADWKNQNRARRDAPVTVAVGDVFVASWGYDQTNIDYYQVTRVISAATIEIRKIAAVSWGTEFMQGRSVPAPDQFTGPPMRKRVRNASDNRAAVRITSFCDAYQMQPVVDGVPAYPSSAWTAYA